MQQIPTLRINPLCVKSLITRDAPHVRGYAVFFSQKFLRLQGLAQDGPAAEELRAQFRLLIFRRADLVHAFEDSLFGARGHRRHRVGFVHHGDVIKNVFAVLVHAANPVLDDDGNFVRKRGVVRAHRGNRQGEYVAVAVLVL